MDRFLGATHAPTLTGNPAQIAWKTGEKQATLGFYYQWGKKDPIIGPPAFNSGSDDPANNAETVESAGWWKKVGNKWTYRKDIDVRGQTSVRDVVKEPTAFYKSTTTDSQQSSQWFPANFADAYTNVAMWGYAVADYSLQGQTFSKTMHDPCPPGYCLPNNKIWADFRDQVQREPTTNVNSVPNSMIRDFPEFNSSISGCYYWPYPSEGLAAVIINKPGMPVHPCATPPE